ncbi:MAG: Gfo/Idh/MocA family oxidoreductase [Firmicutes bacterium]|nr:Gfo/Idh/MocA family oxidoreductase [Bacillota bacterium]
MLRIGLLGCGFIGSIHARALKRIPGVRVTVVADQDPARAGSVAAELGAAVAESCEEAIACPDLDIIDICLPTYLHSRYAVSACQAGKNVFCEKPMAIDLAQADAMIRAAADAGVMLMIGHVLRFWPEYVTIRDIVRSGELGRPLAVTACRLGTAPIWSWDRWLLDPGRGGQAALDLHIHDLDYIAWLLGRPDSVSAVGVRSASGGWDHVFTTIRYDAGPIASAEGTFLVPSSYPFTSSLRVVCEEGAVDYMFRAGKNIEGGDSAPGGVMVYRGIGEASRREVNQADAYRSELEYFVRCLEQGEPLAAITPEDARLSLAISLAAIQSMETGEIVEV